MQRGADPSGAPQRVTSRPDAERLVAAVLATLGALESTLADETALVRVGKIRDGLAQEERKSELAARYLRELEGVKANAVALARFAPGCGRAPQGGSCRLQPNGRDEPNSTRHGPRRVGRPHQDRLGRACASVAAGSLRPGRGKARARRNQRAACPLTQPIAVPKRLITAAAELTM